MPHHKPSIEMASLRTAAMVTAKKLRCAWGLSCICALSTLAGTAFTGESARSINTRLKVVSPVASQTLAPALDPFSIFCRPRQVVMLPSVPESALDFLRKENPQRNERRFQIGVNRVFDHPVAVNAGEMEPNQWLALDNGWRMLSVRVASAGALGMRLHFQNVSLPPGALLVIYDLAKPDSESVVLDAQSFGTNSELWAPTIFADQTVVECQLRPGVNPKQVAFAITGLSHIYDPPVQESFLKEGSCEVDVSCYSAYAPEAAGVARFTYVVAGNTYLCTGCLLATTAQTTNEYFLTARHCVGSQTVASTLEFYWLFQTAGCHGAPPALSNIPKTSGGADLLGVGPSDFSFLRLRRGAPDGVSFLGWSVSPPAAGETLACIHHPDGTYKRICLGTLFDYDIYYWAAQWSIGVTEGGSSGGPLLNSAHQVIGQLGGGFQGPGSSCDNPAAPDEFGRFDLTYPLIKQWIDPSGNSGSPALLAGTYVGLFYDQSSGVVPQSSGYFSVNTTSRGRLTGKIHMGGAVYSFSSQLDFNGVADFMVHRRAVPPLNVHLHVDLSQGADTLNGLISDGNWTATLDGGRSAFDGRTGFSNQAGRYTVVFPGGGAIPAGNSYGTVSVAKSGRLTFLGMLADGSKVAQSTYVSRDGQWPLYTSLYRGQGYLFGGVAFSSNDTTDLIGLINWEKQTANGFSAVTSLTGSVYHPPGRGDSVLNFSEAILALNGGDPAINIQDQVILRSDGHVTSEDGLRLNVAFSLPLGTFRGNVIDPASGRSVPFRGVALQKQNVALGCFSSPTNQSGQVVIQP